MWPRTSPGLCAAQIKIHMLPTEACVSVCACVRSRVWCLEKCKNDPRVFRLSLVFFCWLLFWFLSVPFAFHVIQNFFNICLEFFFCQSKQVYIFDPLSLRSHQVGVCVCKIVLTYIFAWIFVLIFARTLVLTIVYVQCMPARVLSMKLCSHYPAIPSRGPRTN